MNNFTENWDNETLITNSTLHVEPSEKMTDQPDSALLQLILLIVTFLVAYGLKKLRLSIYCGRTVSERRNFYDSHKYV